MSFVSVKRVLPSFSRFNRVLENDFWAGRHFFLRPSELFQFAETSPYFYEGRVGEIRTQRRTPAGKRTVFLMGLMHFLQRTQRLGLSVTFIQDDHSWLFREGGSEDAPKSSGKQPKSPKDALTVDQVIEKGDKESFRKYLQAHVSFTEEDVGAGLDLIRLAGRPLLQTSGNGSKLAAQLAFTDPMAMVFSQSVDPFLFRSPVCGFFEGSLSGPFYFRSLEEVAGDEGLTPEQVVETLLLARHVLGTYSGVVDENDVKKFLRGPCKVSGSIVEAVRAEHPRLNWGWIDRILAQARDQTPVEFASLPAHPPSDDPSGQIQSWIQSHLPGVNRGIEKYLKDGFTRLVAPVALQSQKFPKIDPQTSIQTWPSGHKYSAGSSEGRKPNDKQNEQRGLKPKGGREGSPTKKGKDTAS